MTRLKGLYRGLPRFARAVLSPAKFAYGIAEGLRAGLWMLEGPERYGGKPLVMAYFGSEKRKNYALRAFFGESGRERPLGRAWMWSALHIARSVNGDCAVFLCEIAPILEKWAGLKAFARMPIWIAMEMPMTKDLSSFKSDSRFARAKNMVEKNGLAKGIARNEESFDDFYFNMYLPFINSRHGGSVEIDPYEEAKRRFLTGDWEIVQIKKGPDVLAGVTLEYSNGQARVRHFGVRDGLEEDLKSKMGTASDFFIVVRAAERTDKDVHFGHCRPFLTDGVLNYKRRWGMKVLPARLNEGGLLSLALVKMTPGLEDFLLNNPFVAIDRDGRYRVTGFVRDLDEKGRSQIGEWRRQYCAGSHIGLNVFILAPGEFPSLINGSAPESCEGGSRSGNRPRG